MNYYSEIIPREKLKYFPIRNLRQDVINQIKKRIEDSGYNPARPLSVIKSDGHYLVADGNHRLKVIEEKNIENVPCVVYEDADPYLIAINSNQDEDTYAPMDLFDWLDIIKALREKGLTQEQIGKRIGWSREQVRNYIKLINSIGTNILEIAKDHQIGRVPENGTNVPFNFTEGWFRNSGLYDLPPYYQKVALEAFINNKYKDIRKITNVLMKKIKMRSYVAINLADRSKEGLKKNLDSYYSDIENGLIKDMEHLEELIKKTNENWEEKNKIKIHNADFFDVIDNINNDSIDLLIIDPPYMILSEKWDNFQNKKSFLEFTKQWLDKVMPKLKTTGRAYIFFSQLYEFDLYEILKSNDFYNMNFGQKLIWYYRNNNQLSDRKKYRYCYEPIFYLYGKKAGELNFTADTYGNEQMNVWEVAIPQSNFKEGKMHPAQKPEELYRRIIVTGSKIGDQILDPFAGSGTTGVISKKLKRECILIEKNSEYCKQAERRIANVLD